MFPPRIRKKIFAKQKYVDEFRARFKEKFMRIAGKIPETGNAFRREWDRCCYSHQSVSSQFPSFVFSLNRVSKAILNHPPPAVSCTFPTFLPRRWIFDDRVNYSCKFTSRGQQLPRLPKSRPIPFLFPHLPEKGGQSCSSS